MASSFTSDVDYIPIKRAKNEKKNLSPALIIPGPSTFDCPVCGKKFARKWTLQRHMKNHQHESEFSESDSEEETHDDEQEETQSEENETEKRTTVMPIHTIECLLHMVGAAEIGKLDISTSALRCFVTMEKCLDAEDSITETIGRNAVLAIKEILIAAKLGEIELSVSLYLEILDAIDRAEINQVRKQNS